MINISPATRAHDEALAAFTANDEAISALETQRAQLLADEESARAALGRGESSPAVLESLTGNSLKAAALLQTIESLKAQRTKLIHAVDRATGEMWAEHVRALAPDGTWVALQTIRDELAETIRDAVAEARAKADALTAEAGQLIDQACELDRRRALPRGASYSPVSGLKFDGAGFHALPINDLAEDVGRQLDAEHAEQVRAEALAKHAEEQRVRAAEVAAVDAEYAAALTSLSTAPAVR